MKISPVLAVLIAAAPVLEAKRTSGSNNGESGGNNGNTRTDSNRGGRSGKDGTGDPRRFGGGRFYAGGSDEPYPAGEEHDGIIPHLAPGNEYGGRFEQDVFRYLTGDLTYLNQSNVDPSHPHGTNETRSTECLCKLYQVCGCAKNSEKVFVEALLSSDKAWMTERNGELIWSRDGSLKNGTTAPSAAGRNSTLHKGGVAITIAIFAAVATYFL